MNKDKIVNAYMKEIYLKIEKLRDTFPKAKTPDILQMEKGFIYCAQESAQWLDRTLNILDSKESIVQEPMLQVVDKNIEHTNTISEVPQVVTKKPVMKVLTEGFSDMGKDFFNAMASGAPERLKTDIRELGPEFGKKKEEKKNDESKNK